MGRGPENIARHSQGTDTRRLKKNAAAFYCRFLILSILSETGSKGKFDDFVKTPISALRVIP
jgi:hypothetical protein